MSVGADGRTPFFDWTEYTAGRFGGRPIRCELVTVPGQLDLAKRRKLILSTADAVVFVADSRPVAHEHNRRALLECLETVSELEPPPKLLIQANKQDLEPREDLELLAGVEEKQGIKVIPTIASEGSGIRQVFIYAVRLALERVRAIDSRGELEQLDDVRVSPELLYSQIVSATSDSTAASAPSRSDRTSASGNGDRLDPFLSVPAGSIWPPVEGRMLLDEARRSSIKWRRRADGATTGTGEDWLFESHPTRTFSDAVEARANLVSWARDHTKCRKYLGPQRCLFVLHTGDPGWQVWQLVRREQTIEARLQLLRSDDLGLEEVARRVVECWETTHAQLRAMKGCSHPLTLNLSGLGTNRNRAPYVGLYSARPSSVSHEEASEASLKEFRAFFGDLCRQHGEGDLAEAVRVAQRTARPGQSPGRSAGR